MSFSTIVGIDVSKLTVDVMVLPGAQVCQIENDVKGVNRLLRWLTKDCKVKLNESLFAFENTGYYSERLALMLQKKGYAFTLLPGLELKRSLGISRGKSDRIDAKKIAEYTDLRKHKIVPTQLPDKEIIRMKRLLSMRDRLVKDRAGFKATMGEATRAFGRKEDPFYYQVLESLIKAYDLQIDRLDKELTKVVESKPELKKQFDLIISIQGVGPQTALNMIATTHAFTRFANWRKFACYAGTAPFPYQSGTSIHGKTKVSHLANKTIKSLLGNVAACAIQHNTEMRLYYQKRIQAGKGKMSTQNIVRNKLLARIFAVIERGTPYVETMGYAA